MNLYLNSKLSLEKKFKIEAFWYVFKTFCYQISINFPKSFAGGGGDRKEPLLRYRRKGADQSAIKIIHEGDTNVTGTSF